MKDGTCEYCPDYTKSKDYGTQCRPDRCYKNEIITSFGECETCMYGQTSSYDKRSCILDKVLIENQIKRGELINS